MKKAFLAICLSLCSFLSAFDATIPVLHLPDFYHAETRADFLAKLEVACHEVGFFALTGTGVDVDMLDEAYTQTKAFFAQDFDEKMALYQKDGQRGYAPGESAKGENIVDCKEFFQVGRELSDEEIERLKFWKNLWPEDSSVFRTAMQDLYEMLDTCKNAVGEMFSELLEEKLQYINDMTREGDCLMRVIHYPSNPPADSIWAGAHTDINFFTILPRSTARGLQVLNTQDEWVDVIVPDGAFVINCADMLENLTNGYFRSSVHRVIDPGLGEERYSIVFFVHPQASDRLDPLAHFIEKTGGVRKYANVTRLELLAERLIDLGLASRDLMEFFVNSGAIERLKEVGRFSSKAEAALIAEGLI